MAGTRLGTVESVGTLCGRGWVDVDAGRLATVASSKTELDWVGVDKMSLVRLERIVESMVARGNVVIIQDKMIDMVK
jgi:hypothetical protein